MERVITQFHNRDSEKQVKKIRKCLYLMLVMVLLAGAFGGSGCGGTDSSPLLDMLKLIPDTTETRSRVCISDHARIREIYDVPLPSSDADAEVIEAYLLKLMGDPSDMEIDPTAGNRLCGVSFISGMGPLQYISVSPIRRQNLGFGPLDVDIDISAGYPQVKYEIIKGDFDLSAIEEALSHYDESVLPDIDSYQGITLYIWTYEVDTYFEYEKLAPPVFDEAGRGTTLAVQDDYIFSIDTPGLVKTMIDASQGRTTSLADNADFNLMATALAEMGVYSVFLSDEVLHIDMDDERLVWMFMCIDFFEETDLDVSEIFGEISQEIRDDIMNAAAGELLSVFRTYGAGIGEDDEGPFMSMVYVYDSPQQASSDVDVFKHQIESGFSIWTSEKWSDVVDSLEVWADGRTFQVKLRGDIISMWFAIACSGEALLWCGD
jgi:hypothetical protein